MLYNSEKKTKNKQRFVHRLGLYPDIIGDWGITTRIFIFVFKTFVWEWNTRSHLSLLWVFITLQTIGITLQDKMYSHLFILSKKKKATRAVVQPNDEIEVISFFLNRKHQILVRVGTE
jgi:hypothetical protein